jgi:biopolymer transport protein ExbD
MSPASSSTTKGDSLHLSVLPTGTWMLNGKTVPRDQLLSALRKAGATPETTLYVGIPKTLPLPEVSSFTKLLASGGYRRVFYKRPKHAESSISK